MDIFTLRYPARKQVLHRAHVGVVGSGDLEILLEPAPGHKAIVNIRTSVDGHQPTWRAVLDRFFLRYQGAAKIDINDFGATPGVVAFRLQQAVETLEDFEVDSLSQYTNCRVLNSFIELNARQRARALLDDGTFRELLNPFDRVQSPWLVQQDIVPQFDDGVIVARGQIDSQPAVVISIEGGFQGGSIGEVSGSKIACALDLACTDNERGIPTRAVLVMESGGVRLQEANIGLEVISEIHSSIVSLRQYAPVVGVIAGMVGCFGGMALSAALCSSLIMTRQARLGMNGPEVIEQEAGIDECDSSDRSLIWEVYGGVQRYETGLADALVEDDTAIISKTVQHFCGRDRPSENRLTEADRYLKMLSTIHPSNSLDVLAMRRLLGRRRD